MVSSAWPLQCPLSYKHPAQTDFIYGQHDFLSSPELSAMWRGEVTSTWLGLAIAPAHGQGRGDSVIVLDSYLSRLISSPRLRLLMTSCAQVSVESEGHATVQG